MGGKQDERERREDIKGTEEWKTKKWKGQRQWRQKALGGESHRNQDKWWWKDSHVVETGNISGYRSISTIVCSNTSISNQGAQWDSPLTLGNQHSQEIVFCNSWRKPKPLPWEEVKRTVVLWPPHAFHIESSCFNLWHLQVVAGKDPSETLENCSQTV